MTDDCKETCAFCGALPVAKNISGLYYAQCSNPKCCDNEPYAFMGRMAHIALRQWNEYHSSLKNYSTNRNKGLLSSRRKKVRRG